MKRIQVIGLMATAGLAVAIWFWFEGSPAQEVPSSVGAETQGNSSANAGPSLDRSNASGLSSGPYSAAGLQARQTQLSLWRARLDRAEKLHASYRDATRYPHESRPIAEHPDQVRPFALIQEDLKLLNSKGEPAPGVRIRTSQERVFVSGNESVRLSIAAVDDNNLSLPVSIRNAAARSIPDTRTPVKLIQANLTFTDQGNGADEVAGDAVYTSRLHPVAQGFDGYNGTIRVLAEVTAGGQPGTVQFDVVYSSDVPATWGSAREAVEAGSLNFYIKVNVRQTGRYVVSGRVDDATGAPFALAQFNEELAAGSREVRLQVFGALIRDKGPAFPLRLRDVDGFLLIPDKFPDRSMMARLPGVLISSANYPRDKFSNQEWTSEERERYLTEYAKDAETARQQVQELTPK